MEKMQLPQDFKEFLKLLNSNKVEYLLVGGYAVGYHGYPRATVDMDIWIAINKNNAQKMITVIKEFGFDVLDLSVELFLEQKRVIRMGVPPIRIEILTDIDGVEFNQCYRKKTVDEIDGVNVCIIDYENLKKNKKASGRLKDLADLEFLS